MGSDHDRLMEELRHRAEVELIKNGRKVTSPETYAQMHLLVYELEVHQIELEMQNSDLQQTRSHLESYLSQYTDLYDFAPVGYLTLDINGLILQINLTGVRMLGIDRARLLNQHFSQFVISAYRPEFDTLLAKVFKSHSQKTSVIRLQKEGGGKFIVHVEAKASEDQRECLVAMIDITAQKHAEESLQESEIKYRTLYENMSQGVIHMGKDGKIESANPAAQLILGLSIDQMQEETWLEHKLLTINEDGTECSDLFTMAHSAGSALHNMIMGVFLPNANGYIWLNISVIPQFLPGEERPFQVFITFEDITNRKRMRVYNKLTSREKEIFKLLAKGLKRNIIGKNLGISVKTVDKHRENLMEKLNLYKIEEIVQFAKFLGLV